MGNVANAVGIGAAATLSGAVGYGVPRMLFDKKHRPVAYASGLGAAALGAGGALLAIREGVGAKTAGTVFAGLAGLGAGAYMATSNVLVPRDKWNEVDKSGTAHLGYGELFGGAALAVAGAATAAITARTHTKVPFHLPLVAGIVGTAIAGMGSGIVVGSDSTSLGRLLGGFGFNGTPDTNGPAGPTPQPKRVNNDYVASAGDILPDGIPQLPERLFVAPGLPGHQSLRFTTTMANLGNGPMEIQQLHLGDHGVKQLVENANHPDAPSVFDVKGQFIYHPAHHHIHFADWATVSLLPVVQGSVGERKVGDAITVSHKLSFNVGDSVRKVDPALDPQSRLKYRHEYGGEHVQGISPGYDDTYGPLLAGQFVPLDKVKPGTYVLRMQFDPKDEIAESNEANNVRDTVITLHKDALGFMHVTKGASGPPGHVDLTSSDAAARTEAEVSPARSAYANIRNLPQR